MLHFYETSKRGTRPSCSMHLCGNRFKVAAYAARQRNYRAKMGLLRGTQVRCDKNVIVPCSERSNLDQNAS